MISLASQNLGDFYTEFGKEEIARKLLKNNLAISNTLYKQNKSSSGRVTGAHFHLTKHYRAFSHFNMALVHLDSCEIIGKANNHIRIYDSYHRAELARVYVEIRNIDTAQIILHELDSIISIRLNDSTLHNHLKGFLSVIDFYLEDTYFNEKNYLKAIHFYSKAIDINDQYKRYNSLQSAILGILAIAEFKLKKYQEAYQSLKLSKKFGDETFSITSKQNRSLIEIKSEYESEIEAQKLALLEKDKILADKSKRILIVEGLLIGVFLMVIIGLLFYRNQKQKSRFQQEKTDGAYVNPLKNGSKPHRQRFGMNLILVLLK